MTHLFPDRSLMVAIVARSSLATINSQPEQNCDLAFGGVRVLCLL